jgi:hypothetical protein
MVSLHDVIDEMELSSDEATAYINRNTGELITLTDEEVALAEDPDAAAHAPQWQKTSCPRCERSWRRKIFYPCPVNSRFTSGPSWSALPGRSQMLPWVMNLTLLFTGEELFGDSKTSYAGWR